jgi:hypothetical protein
MRSARNTVIVLAVIAVLTLGLYVGVEVSATVANTTTTADAPMPVFEASIPGQTYLCPQTACSAKSCHAVTGTSPGLVEADGNGSGSDSGELQTCPRTGCTASSCHGATGSPPPSAGGGGGYGGGMGGMPLGRGDGRRWRSENGAQASPAPDVE